jgi:hypothetical protein
LWVLGKVDPGAEAQLNKHGWKIFQNLNPIVN